MRARRVSGRKQCKDAPPYDKESPVGVVEVPQGTPKAKPRRMGG